MQSPQATPVKPPQVPPFSLGETTPLTGSTHTQGYDFGLCGKFTSFVLKNLALFGLLLLGLVALAVLFPSQTQHLLGLERCVMHHDPAGKLWLECPERIPQTFGPRRY